jgi:carboxypeptidase C (cathepsin A)
MDGAMMEVGPYRVTPDGNLSYNNGSWDEFANLLFVDQPVGTGFSYVNTDSYLSELEQMAEHMIIFLEKWFALFPEYEHDDVRLHTYATIESRLTASSSTLQANHTQANTSHTLHAPFSNETKTRAIDRGH